MIKTLQSVFGPLMIDLVNDNSKNVSFLFDLMIQLILFPVVSISIVIDKDHQLDIIKRKHCKHLQMTCVYHYFIIDENSNVPRYQHPPQ